MKSQKPKKIVAKGPGQHLLDLARARTLVHEEKNKKMMFDNEKSVSFAV